MSTQQENQTKLSHIPLFGRWRGLSWAARRHHNQFAALVRNLGDRREALREVYQSLADLEQRTSSDGTTRLLRDHEALSRLAATDLFVEKAQQVLTKRARWVWVLGTIVFLFSAALLSTAGVLAYEAINQSSSTKLETNELILKVARALIFGGYVIIALRILVALGRSFFHEGTVLLNRRHAMRFGRMIAHRKPFTDLTIDQLETAFGWNTASDSSFRDIDVNKVTETVVGNLLNLKAAADAVADTKKF